MLGQAADRDAVDAALGDGADAFEANAAGYFQRHASRGDLDRAAALVRAEVVDQDAVGACFDSLSKFLEALDLDDDRNPGRQPARPLDDRSDAAGRGDVVLFHHHRVEQADPVVVAAAAAHRVLLRQAQAGEGLAGVEDARAGAGDGLDERSGAGGRGRQRLQEIDRAAFGREQGAAGAFEGADLAAGLKPLAVDGMPGDAQLGVERAEAGLEPVAAGEYRAFAADERGMRACVRIDQRGGDVAAADVFFERAHHVERNARALLRVQLGLCGKARHAGALGQGAHRVCAAWPRRHRSRPRRSITCRAAPPAPSARPAFPGGTSPR